MRKIIQISGKSTGCITALCDDGTVWIMYNVRQGTSAVWTRLPDIPQEQSGCVRIGTGMPVSSEPTWIS